MKEKYFCKNCEGERNHEILFEKSIKGSDHDDYFHWKDDYLIIECCGCENISFLNIYGNTEMIHYNEQGETDGYFKDYILYPYYLESGRELGQLYVLPKGIQNIYKETISALKAKAYILTAGGFRAIIEALCNHLKIKSGYLSNRIDLLFEKGFLTLKESKRLHSIRFLGNDALHEIQTPKKENLYALLDIVNHLLENLFYNDSKLGGIGIIIDNYQDFLKLLSNKLSEDNLHQELTLDKILGKSKRFIKDKFRIEFEKKLVNDIEEKKFEYLSIIKKENNISFRINKIPDLFPDF